MKALVCEMCGSHDIIKKEGMYECQSCGTKYTVEEAKKLMIEGTVDVKVNKTEEFLSYIEAGRRAREANSFEDMERFYNLAKEAKPHDWEAILYSTYARVALGRIVDNPRNAKLLANTIDSVKSLFVNAEIDNKPAMMGKVIKDINQIYNMLFVASFDHVKEYYGGAQNNEPVLLCLGAYSEAIKSLSTICIESGAINDENEQLLVNSFSAHQTRIVEFYEYLYSKSASTASAYLRPAFTNLIDEDEVLIHALDAGKNHEKPVLKMMSSSNNSGGGCYIATSVYGSYDCPEVWTLRRFRDDTLSKTWYGRAFIRVYYAISPTLVKRYGDTTWFKKMWKGTLDSMVHNLKAKGVKDTPYNDRQW